MNEVSTGGYALLGIFIYAAFLHGHVAEFLHRREIRRLVSFDRIARLADIGEKDLVFRINGTSNISHGAASTKGKEFRVTFLYAAPMSLGVGGRRFPQQHIVGEVVFDSFSNCSALEDKIAKAIVAVKQEYVAGSRV